MQEDDVAVMLADRDVVIFQVGERLGEPGQLVIMGREESPGAKLRGVMNILDDRPGNRQPVVRARSAADFV